jgi:hypothetical protein
VTEPEHEEVTFVGPEAAAAHLDRLKEITDDLAEIQAAHPLPPGNQAMCPFCGLEECGHNPGGPA